MVLKHLPHSFAGANVPEVITLPGTTLPTGYSSELTLGGWRSDPTQTTDGGTEHGVCTVHEVIITSSVLTDAELQGVYGKLRTKWQ